MRAKTFLSQSSLHQRPKSPLTKPARVNPRGGFEINSPGAALFSRTSDERKTWRVLPGLSALSRTKTKTQKRIRMKQTANFKQGLRRPAKTKRAGVIIAGQPTHLSEPDRRYLHGLPV